MNPLLNHPILRMLPYDLLKNPDVNKIQEYFKKKSRMWRRIKFAILIAYPFVLLFTYLLWDVNTHVKGMIFMNRLADILPVISFPIIAMWSHQLEKKHVISDDEILKALETSNQNAQQ